MKLGLVLFLALAGCSSSSGGAGRLDAGADAADAGDAAPEACTMVIHSDGLGGTWQDCAPLDTYSELEALTACEVGTGSSCVIAVCTPDGGPGPSDTACGCVGGGSPGSLITCPGGSTCDCWGYAAPYAGLVSVSTTTQCHCQQIGGPTWH